MPPRRSYAFFDESPDKLAVIRANQMDGFRRAKLPNARSNA